MADTSLHSHRSNTDLERPLLLLHKIEPTARRSSFADMHMRDIGRWIVAAIEHDIRSAQNAAAGGHLRSLGTISSSRCQTTRARRTTHGRGECENADLFFGRAKRLILRTRLQQASIGITAGGARRDRTDDLLLAKQALSQLSYGPGRTG